MEERDFVLQSRYEVRPAVNLITDTVLQKEVRVEPRLMKLLCMLAKQPGNLVRREQLVTEIWSDYGGGEAGLNHAVSSLRKLLNDSSKELIETVPTRGYILHAKTDHINNQNATKVPELKRLRRHPILYISATVFGTALFCFLYLFQTGHKKDAASPPSTKRELYIPFDSVNKKTEETGLNTIMTVGEDSTVYKLKVIGDRRPEFYINGRLLSPDEMEKHLDLIHNMEKKLRERNQ